MLFIMISIEAYRSRIGNFNCRKIVCKQSGSSTSQVTYLKAETTFYIFYVLFQVYFLALSLSMLKQFSPSPIYISYSVPTPPPFQVPSIALCHLKLFYSVLITFLIKKVCDKVNLYCILNNNSMNFSCWLKSMFAGSYRSKWSIHLLLQGV